MGSKGIVASSAALGVLLQQGIGDTIRISLTPEPGGDRTLEVKVAQELLQTMGFRMFVPLVAACPGCGRTTSTTFQELARDIQGFIRDSMPDWKTRYPGVEALNVAVMGCIVNGPGESKHADIGISLPGTGETADRAGVHRRQEGRDACAARRVAADFKKMVIDYIERRWGTAARAAEDQDEAVALTAFRVTILDKSNSPKVRHEFAERQGRPQRYRHMADESEPYETIGVDKLTPIIGAEIGGIDLAKPLSNRTVDEIHRALAENIVIFFRDQHITPQQHLAFGRLFGELHVHPAAPHEPDEPALMKIYADKDSPRANGEGWHTDVSCDSSRRWAAFSISSNVRRSGGDTLFASMYAAYDALSDRMKAYLEGLTAVHDGEDVYRGLYTNHRRRRQAGIRAPNTRSCAPIR